MGLGINSGDSYYFNTLEINMKWTDTEVSLLREKALKGLSPKEIQKFFKGRTVLSITKKLCNIGISLKKVRAKLNKDKKTKVCTKCGEEKSKGAFPRPLLPD